MKLALISDGRVIDYMMQLNFFAYLKRNANDINLNTTLFISNDKEAKKAIAEHSGLFDTIVTDEVCEKEKYDFVVSAYMLPDIVWISNNAKENRNLETIFNYYHSLKENAGTSKFYSNTHFYDFNVLQYLMLRGKNCINAWDCDGLIDIPANEYLFELNIGADNHQKKSVVLNTYTEAEVGKWEKERWNELVDIIRKNDCGYELVQVCGEQSESLDHVDRIVCCSDMEEALKVVAAADVMIGSMNHFVQIRNCIKRDNTIVLHGPFPAAFYGHKNNVNIADAQCIHWCAGISDIWDRQCMNASDLHVCMKSISVENVYNAFCDMMNSNG